ncbi:unnamed protein product [Colias eurytheme]|nr:unnamed protein product [Colias eurytheme]
MHLFQQYPFQGAEMGLLHRVWLKLTPTKALQHSAREETMFFEYMYRVTYLEGISFSETNIGYWIYSSTVKSLILLLVFSEVWQFLSAPLTIDTVIDSTNIIAIQMSAYYKYRSRLVHKNVFRRLASSMNSPNFDLSTAERKKLLEVWQKRNEAHLKLLLALGTCTLIAWYITSQLREILSRPMLAQMVVSTTLICCIGFQVAISTAIGDALYFSGWEGGITKIPGVKSSMLLILARANKPLVMSAGGMYDLSLEAYATVSVRKDIPI